MRMYVEWNCLDLQAVFEIKGTGTKYTFKGQTPAEVLEKIDNSFLCDRLTGEDYEYLMSRLEDEYYQR